MWGRYNLTRYIYIYTHTSTSLGGQFWGSMLEINHIQLTSGIIQAPHKFLTVQTSYNGSILWLQCAEIYRYIYILKYNNHSITESLTTNHIIMCVIGWEVAETSKNLRKIVQAHSSLISHNTEKNITHRKCIIPLLFLFISENTVRYIYSHDLRNIHHLHQGRRSEAVRLLCLSSGFGDVDIAWDGFINLWMLCKG